MIKKPFETFDEYYKYSKEHTKDGYFGLLAKFDSIYYAYGALAPYGAYVFKRDADGNYDAEDVGLSNDGAVQGVEYIKSSTLKAYSQQASSVTTVSTLSIHSLLKESSCCYQWTMGC